MTKKSNEKRRIRKAAEAKRRRAEQVLTPPTLPPLEVERRRAYMAAIKKEFFISAPYPAVAAAMQEKKYAELMRLLKLMNSLTFLLATMVEGDPNSNSSRQRSVRQSGSLLLTATLCEALKNVNELGKYYGDHKDFQQLREVASDPVVAAAWPYLKRVRDKVGFHADPIMGDGSAVLADQIVIFEHNTGWNKLNTHYAAVDVIAAMIVMKDDLPTDEQLSVFHAAKRLTFPLWPPTTEESAQDGLIRRSFVTTTLLCNALIHAVQEFTVTVHQEMGGTIRPGSPPA